MEYLIFVVKSSQGRIYRNEVFSTLVWSNLPEYGSKLFDLDKNQSRSNILECGMFDLGKVE